MFLSTKRRLQTLLDVVDDMLLGAPPEDDLPLDPEPPLPHPHSRTVRLRIERRPGAVTPRPGHCLSPIERPAAPRPRDPVA